MALIQGTKLTFVRKKHEHDDVYSFYFKPDRPLKHTAGQHGFISVPGFRGMKAFSLASAPEDSQVVIGTHVHATSKYKQLLANLKEGDTVKIRGPILNFILDPKDSQVVFLAQGIGITPFRSLLRHIKIKQLKVHTTLLHVSGQEHTFGVETKKLADDAYYVSGSKDFKEKLAQIIREQPGARYYISGGRSFLMETTRFVKQHGVAGSRIKKDPFLGY